MAGFVGVRPTESTVDQQLSRFTRGDSGLTPEYRANVSGQLHRYLIRAAGHGTSHLASGSCETESGVQVPGVGVFPQPPGSSRTPTEEAFEEGFFRTWAITCVPGASPSEVAEVYMDPGFRRRVMPNLVGITVSTDRICVSTEGVAGIVDPTAICMRAARFEAEGLVAVHSVLDENGPAPDLHPVYYRDSLVAFVATRMADGSMGTGVWRMTQIRGQDLGPLAGSLLKRTVARTTEQVQAELVRRAGR